MYILDFRWIVFPCYKDNWSVIYHKTLLETSMYTNPISV